MRLGVGPGRSWFRPGGPQMNVFLACRPALAAALVLSLSAHAQAQTRIEAGQPVMGRLDANSPRTEDGLPYQLYEYRGQAGQRIGVRLDSSEFDAFLVVGSVAAPGCSEDCRSDDDGGEGLNSALSYVLPSSGRIEIRASSVNSSASGSFRLSVDNLPPLQVPRPQPLVFGQPVSGRLDHTSARDDSGRPYMLWSLAGSEGTAVQIRLDSSDFDAYLEFGYMDGERFVSLASDDDGGVGLNARLDVRLGREPAVIKASSISGSANGSYTLLAGEPLQQRPIVVQAIKIGDAIRGQLNDEDPFDDNEIRYDVYRIEGRPGQRVIVRMDSRDFDPLLRWGTFDGEVFQQEAMDDDSGGGSSAMMTVTLDEDGIGRLIATAFAAAQGGYTLSVVAAPRPAQAR